MSNPVQIRIRCDDEVREAWVEAKGKFDMTHGEFAEKAAEFVLENETGFERFCGAEKRDASDEPRL